MSHITSCEIDHEHNVVDFVSYTWQFLVFIVHKSYVIDHANYFHSWDIPTFAFFHSRAFCFRVNNIMWMIPYHTEECFVFYFWHPMLVRPVMRRLFFPWKTKKKKARFARAPHDNIFLRALRYTYSLWQHPGESPTYILHKDKTIFCVKLST